MKQKEIDNICNRIVALENFMKSYYSLEEDSEFKIWLEHHKHKEELTSFFDNLHQIMPTEFSSALTNALRGSIGELKKIIKTHKKLFNLLQEHIYTPELFNQEWNAYIGNGDDYIEIIFSPDNDNEESEKIIKFTIMNPNKKEE